MKRKDMLFLFDVDGTLTPSRLKMPDSIKDMLENLRQEVCIAFVGGSDIAKQKEQMGEDCLKFFDYGFPENGVSFFQCEKLVSQKRMIDKLGEDRYKEFVNFCLHYLADLDIPIKRGTFLECRASMVNISPIGRNCSQQERIEFFEFDKRQNTRHKMVDALREKFDDYDLQFSIGGQISIDCFPKGWDKRYCLQHVKAQGIKRVVFFGDKTMEGGNDYEIYNDPGVEGIEVKNPEETLEKVNKKLEEIKQGK